MAKAQREERAIPSLAKVSGPPGCPWEVSSRPGESFDQLLEGIWEGTTSPDACLDTVIGIVL